MQNSSYLIDLFKKTLAGCSPEKAVSQHLSVEGDQLIAGESAFVIRDRPIFLLAVGKASVPMFESASDILGDRVTGSLVITPDAEAASHCRADQVITGSHPVPDNQSLAAGRAAVACLEKV